MDVTSYMLGKKAGGGITAETDPIFSASAASEITSTDITNWNSKQDTLVSGTDIKTINNTSILGSGNLDIGSDLPIFYIEDNSLSNPLVLETAELGVYIFKPQNFASNGRMYVYLKAFENSGNRFEDIVDTDTIYYYVNKITTQTPSSTVLMYKNANIGVNQGKYKQYQEAIIKNSTEYLIGSTTKYIWEKYDVEQPGVASTITAKKTFSTLPESSVTPTTNNQLANKKYVDDSIAAAITTTLGGNY